MTTARTPFSRRIAAVLALVALAGSAVACTKMTRPGTPEPSGPVRWEGHAKEVFDDNIDPTALGLSLENTGPRGDALLRERVQMADVVSQIRVKTVTRDSVGDQVTYHLSVELGTQYLAPKLPERSFELVIPPSSAAFGIAKAFDSRLRGMTFIGLIERFAGEYGEPALHWHLSPDTPEVAAAVKEAATLREWSTP